MQIIERTVDLSKSWERSGILPQEIRLRRGEHGLSTLRIIVTDNGAPHDLSGCTIRFCCQYWGGKFVREAMEVREGAAELVVTSTFTAVSGHAAVSYLEITQDGKVIDTDTLPVYILENVDMASGEAAQYRSEVDEIEAEMQAARDAMVAQKAEFDAQEAARQKAEEGRVAAESERQKRIGEVDEALTAATQAAQSASEAVEAANEAAETAGAAAESVTSALAQTQAATESANSAADAANAATETATAKMGELDAAEQARETAETAREEWYAATKQAVDDGELNGATFTPSVDDGILSWTNDRELPNPEQADIRGPKGDQGDGLMLLDSYESLEALQAAHPDNNQVGDAYMGGTHYYTWTGTDWADCGELQGAKGDTGDRGPEGAPGKDGVSVTHEWKGTTLSVTSASGTSSADLQGPQGDQGLTGPEGAKGDAGPKGDTGGYYEPTVSEEGQLSLIAKNGAPEIGDTWNIKGPKGATGDVGAAGAKGDTGGYYEPSVSDEGVLSLIAKNGAPAIATTWNIRGPQGATGAAGPAGPAGPTGPAGKDGSVTEDVIKAILLRAHPIGSYYWSSDKTSPQTLFGGTWESVTNKFIYAVPTSSSAGQTGGAETVTLTTAQMPSHSHSGPSHSHGLNSHTHSMSHTHGLNSHTHSTPNHTHGISTNGRATVGFGATGESLKNRLIVEGSTGQAGLSVSSGGASTTGAATGNTAAASSTATGAASGSTASGGTGSTGTAGSGNAHENMPPYETAYCWKRVA